jgi:NAD+ diphosphatase
MPTFPPPFTASGRLVEPGESLEGTVQREIREEVGIEVTDIRYFGSQPWAVPQLADDWFHRALGRNEITVDQHELAALIGSPPTPCPRSRRRQHRPPPDR